MNVKSVEKEATRASVTVELTREELEPALNRAYLKYRKDIMIPGFRKGHAPRMVIEAAYGKHVFFEDAVEDMFPDIYKDAVLTQDIRPVGRPSVSKMDIADDGAVTLTIVTDLYPVAELGEYKNLEIEKAEVEVKESEVEAELDRMAQNVARITTVDRPAQEGDTAVIDFEGFENGKAFAGGKGENYELKLGSHTFIPGFEEQVAGMSAGEEKDIDVTFPADYHAEELAGKPVVFKVKVHEVKETVVPEKDDEFVKDVSEFDTVAELRAEIGHILGIDNGHKLIIVGAGHLGHALLQNFDFKKVGFQIDTAFDVSPALVGTKIHDVVIRSMDELEDYVSENHPNVAVLTVPQNVAQPLTDRLIELGIRGFWNFTNVELSSSVPDVFFENVHFVDTLLTLSYRISRP